MTIHKDRLVRNGVLVSFLIIGLCLTSCQNKIEKKMINQPAITKIKHHTKIQVKPLYWIADDHLVFYIHLESTQNPNSINQNPITTMLVEINQSIIIEPSEWIEKKKSTYHVEGTLHFPIQTTPKSLTLSWFDLTEIQLKWTLPESITTSKKKE